LLKLVFYGILLEKGAVVCQFFKQLFEEKKGVTDLTKDFVVPILKLKWVGLLKGEINDWKEFGGFLCRKRKEIIRNPELFSDRQKMIFDKIQKEFLGRCSILNLKSTSI